MRTFRTSATATFAFAFVLFLVNLVVTVIYQWRAGAFSAEMASVFPDEGPHYINSLLIARYLADGLGSNPMSFAQSFYLHYPKVSIGHWPPAFYVLEALWMLMISESIRAQILFSGIITAALATLLGVAAGRRHGRLAGLIAGLVFATLPVIREITTSLMVDVFIGLLALASALLYIQYLNAWRQYLWAALFGLASSVAILSKGNGLEMALVPPLAVLLTGRFSLLRQPSFWLPLGIVVTLCGPWTALTYKATAVGFMYSWGTDFMATAGVSNSGFLLKAVGPVMLVLAAIGLAGAWRLDGVDRQEFNRRCGLGALVLAVFLFQSVVPSGIDARYIIPALAPLILLAACGIEDISRIRSGRIRGGVVGRALAVGLLLLALAPDVMAIATVATKPRLGMSEAIGMILGEHPPGPNPMVLIGASGNGESAFIAAMAAADHSHAVIAARGFKLLSSDDFMGTDYAARFVTPEEVAAEVERVGVSYVVLDTSPKSMRFEHNRQLAEAAKLHNWRLLVRLPRADYPGETLLYRVDCNVGRSVDIVPLAHLLGAPSLF